MAPVMPGLAPTGLMTSCHTVRAAATRLDLGFLVDTQHKSSVRRIEAKPYDVADLIENSGSVESLKLSLR